MPDKIADKVASLLDGWRTLSQWEKEEHPGYRTWNSLVDKLNRIAAAAVADPNDVQALTLIAERDEDPSVRLRARQVVHPYVPRPDSETDLNRWLNNPLVNLGSVQLTPEVGLALVPKKLRGLGDSPDSDMPNRTWLLGEPTSGLPHWPRRSDNISLCHLAQIELDDQLPLTNRRPGLPTKGVLQFFHDLEAIGDDPTDGQQGCWLVHYIPRPTKKLLPRPEDLDGEAFRARQQALVEVTWTFPSPLDLDLSDELFERIESANQRVTETVCTGWGLDEVAGPLDAVPLMFGHGTESRQEAIERLESVLPLRSDDDSYVLLLDVPGEGPFEGWIGDMGHLEFWIRDSDLKRRAFDQAWALLR